MKSGSMGIYPEVNNVGWDDLHSWVKQYITAGNTVHWSVNIASEPRIFIMSYDRRGDKLPINQLLVQQLVYTNDNKNNKTYIIWSFVRGIHR